MNIDERIAEKYDAEALKAAFEENDPTDLPDGYIRMTAGHGGESYLITKYEKTLLIDTGMAYCGDKLVENIRHALGGRTLDVVVLTHTHYDHIGALPFIIEEFPEAEICGSAYGQYVFTRDGAKRMIRAMSENAEKLYGDPEKGNASKQGFRITRALADGEAVGLGADKDGNSGLVRAIECKGHTDCSMAYMIEPDMVLFSSESTGIIQEWDSAEVSIMKKYENMSVSLEKCRSLGARRIVIPHYGILPPEYKDAYWDIYEWCAKDERDFIGALVEKGCRPDEILAAYTERCWDPKREEETPKAAFDENAKNVIKVYLEYFGMTEK
ncbi:MAG: MBL fold metallo-hydrolase [Anaerovoracaceae bacterium]|jgi:glyoxylase-like metal-dependent hydrolase (beta-lactamase superfamily II)